jgi:hypothetical protein
MPSGATGDWGSSPSVRASALAGRRWTAVPSRRTLPARGVRSRDIERSSVDLPHALGPTIAVIRPGGTATESPAMTVRSP